MKLDPRHPVTTLALASLLGAQHLVQRKVKTIICYSCGEEHEVPETMASLVCPRTGVQVPNPFHPEAQRQEAEAKLKRAEEKREKRRKKRGRK